MFIVTFSGSGSGEHETDFDSVREIPLAIDPAALVRLSRLAWTCPALQHPIWALPKNSLQAEESSSWARIWFATIETR